MHEIDFGIKEKFFLEITNEHIDLDIRRRKISGYPSEHRTTTISIFKRVVNRKVLSNLANSIRRRKIRR